jgi:hypothetical protein
MPRVPVPRGQIDTYIQKLLNDIVRDRSIIISFLSIVRSVSNLLTVSQCALKSVSIKLPLPLIHILKGFFPRDILKLIA